MCLRASPSRICLRAWSIFLTLGLVGATCRDSSQPYVGDWGENCRYWKGKDCELLPEARGASDLGKNLLRCKCPSTCKVAQSECFTMNEDGTKNRIGYPTVCPVCQQAKAGIHHNNCQMDPLRERGETCVFNYQCSKKYCCPHLRVCLDDVEDRLFIIDIEKLNGVDKTRIIASPPDNRRACEPSGEMLQGCLEDTAVSFGSVSPTYDLRKCNCKESFLYHAYRNTWVPCPEIPDEELTCTDFNYPIPPPPEEPNIALAAAGVTFAVLIMILVVVFAAKKATKAAKLIAIKEDQAIAVEKERRAQLVAQLTLAKEAHEASKNKRRASINDMQSELSMSGMRDALADYAHAQEDKSSSEDSSDGRKAKTISTKKSSSFDEAIFNVINAPYGCSEEAEQDARAWAGLPEGAAPSSSSRWMLGVVKTRLVKKKEKGKIEGGRK